jgi:hypothetical protein
MPYWQMTVLLGYEEKLLRFDYEPAFIVKNIDGLRKVL